MASKKKSIGKKPSEPRTEQVSFSVEPGTKLKITISCEVGLQVLQIHKQVATGAQSFRWPGLILYWHVRYEELGVISHRQFPPALGICYRAAIV